MTDTAIRKEPTRATKSRVPAPDQRQELQRRRKRWGRGEDEPVPGRRSRSQRRTPTAHPEQGHDDVFWPLVLARNPGAGAGHRRTRERYPEDGGQDGVRRTAAAWSDPEAESWPPMWRSPQRHKRRPPRPRSRRSHRLGLLGQRIDFRPRLHDRTLEALGVQGLRVNLECLEERHLIKDQRRAGHGGSAVSAPGEHPMRQISAYGGVGAPRRGGRRCRAWRRRCTGALPAPRRGRGGRRRSWCTGGATARSAQRAVRPRNG